MEIHRSYFYYESVKDDTEVEEAIRNVAKYGEGFWKIFELLRSFGKPWNHKKVYRVYKKMHYEKRVRLKKRLPARVKNPLEQPKEPNTTWSIDFMSDVLECGRKFRVLNVIDDSDRIAVAQEVSMSFPAKRVIKTLEKAIWLNGKPRNIRCDNGPEFIAKEFREWCAGNDIKLLFIQPGCPTQNSYIERFNGTYRRAVLDAYIFRTIGDVRNITDEWTYYYNNERPHETLGNMPPSTYREKKEKEMIDVQICKCNSAYELCKAETSAFQAALHTSTANASGGLSEINQLL